MGRHSSTTKKPDQKAKVNKKPKSHWKQTYEDFIATARQREDALIASGDYYEIHHILPTSLKGGNEPANLLAITAEEHFYCHYWLAELHSDNQWEAVRAMVDLKGNQHRGRHAIRTHLPEIAAMVAKAREESSKAKAVNTALLHQDPEWLAKLHNPETQQKRSEAMQNQRWYTNGTDTIRLYTDEPVPDGYRSGRTISEEQRAAIVAAAKLAVMSDSEREKRRKRWQKNNPMHNPEIRALVGAASKEYHNRPDVVAKKRERMLECNPMMTTESREKAKVSMAKTRKANPLKFAKTPVIYEGKELSLRQAAKKLGIIDSGVTARSRKLGVSVQEAFDWWANKTPEERERERVLGSKGVDWRGERLLKSDICERYKLNYWTVHSRGKRNGLEWLEAAEQILAERE